MQNAQGTYRASRFTSLFRPPWSIFLLSALIALALVPWVVANWVPQGDEPHYLLAAHSLVFDGDLDLKNNYAQGDFRQFYDAPIDRHVRIGVDGRSYLSHDIGLPILIAPAYALGGRAGVTIFLAIVAALVAVNVYLLAFEVTGDRTAAVITWLVLSLTPLLSVYAYLVYPEMIGALLVIWSVRQILPHPLPPLLTTIPRSSGEGNALLPLSRSIRSLRERGVGGEVAVAISMLPWLSARFVPIAVFLALWSARRWRGDWHRRSIVIGLPLISLIGYFAANAWMSGGAGGPIDFNSGSIARGLRDFSPDRIVRGLAGWWLDQQRGLLVYSPVYVVALIGLPILWRRLRGIGVLLLAPFSIAYLSAVAWGGFWIGWEISARYLVVGLPLLAAPLALAWMTLRSLAFRGMAGATFAIGLLNTVLILAMPGIAAYRESVVWIYDHWLSTNLWRGLPAMGGGALVEPDPNAPSATTVVTDGDRSSWMTPAGPGGVVIQSSGLQDLTIGAYELRFEARAADAPSPDSPLLLVDVFSGEGVMLLHRVLNASDFAPDGTYHTFVLPFESPFYNKWSYPVYAQVTASGLAKTWVSGVSVALDASRLWGVTGLWIGVIGLAIVGFNWRGSRPRSVPRARLREVLEGEAK